MLGYGAQQKTMKLTRVSAKDKSIGGVTNGTKWRYNADIGEMDVPENVGKALIATGDFEAVKTTPKDKSKSTVVPSGVVTSDGITVVERVPRDNE